MRYSELLKTIENTWVFIEDLSEKAEGDREIIKFLSRLLPLWISFTIIIGKKTDSSLKTKVSLPKIPEIFRSGLIIADVMLDMNLKLEEFV